MLRYLILPAQLFFSCNAKLISVISALGITPSRKETKKGLQPKLNPVLISKILQFQSLLELPITLDLLIKVYHDQLFSKHKKNAIKAYYISISFFHIFIKTLTFSSCSMSLSPLKYRIKSIQNKNLIWQCNASLKKIISNRYRGNR